MRVWLVCNYLLSQNILLKIVFIVVVIIYSVDQYLLFVSIKNLLHIPKKYYGFKNYLSTIYYITPERNILFSLLVWINYMSLTSRICTLLPVTKQLYGLDIHEGL